MKKMKGWVVVILALCSVLGMVAGSYAGEKVYALRTVEDPSVTVDDSICAAGGFTPNVRLGAYVWTYEARSSDGGVVNDMIRNVGTARACVQIRDPYLRPYFVMHPFYIRFDLDVGSYAGSGFCTITSNNVPVPDLVLAGCTLTLSELPSGNAVGSAISSSVFNPFRLSGFSTGSYWALRLYSE